MRSFSAWRTITSPWALFIDEKDWALEITGLVKRPMTLTLREFKARPRHEIIFTLESAPAIALNPWRTAWWAMLDGQAPPWPRCSRKQEY
jgi:hypothetical protein